MFNLQVRSPVLFPCELNLDRALYRSRRVKCDETKPNCLRCQRFGWDCDGYVQPRHESGWRLALADKLNLRLLSKPPQEPSPVLFETDLEGRFYRLFVERTASSLGGYYDLDLWDRTILQASVGVSSIRHIVIALAALDLSSMITISQPPSSLLMDRQQSGSDHTFAHRRHRFALQQYGTAIKEMREDISGPNPDLRTTLIATILIVCFEAYHGNYEAALRQFYSGHQVLAAWKAARPNLIDDGFSSPAPHIVEDDVILTFTQLEIHTIAHTDRLSVDTHMLLKESGTSQLLKMPAAFQTLSEAIIYATIVIRRCVHFMAVSWIYGDENAVVPDTSFSLLDRAPACSSTEGFRDQDKHFKELRRWHDAFLPILLRARTPDGHKDFLAATCMYMHHLTVYIGVITQLASDELIYDTLTSMFVEIIACAKVVYECDQKSNFTSAFRAVVSLDFLAKKCRDPKIRREAIRLLLAKPRREDLFDSILAAKVCLWVMNIEEEGMIGDYVTDEMRVREIGVKFRQDEQKLYVCCKQPKKGSKEMVLRETVLVL
jgi:hypothetical protein